MSTEELAATWTPDLSLDLTRRARTPSETTGRREDATFMAVYERAGIGIAEVDAAGTLLRVNTPLCALMGFTREQLQGRSIFDETFTDDRARDREQFRRQIAGEIERYSIEKRIRRVDGGYIWVSITSSSVRDAHGRFLYAVRVQHDIDDRKRAQEQLARRMDELAALYRLSERVQHAASLTELYEPALDAIIRALRCQRASILLLDTSDTMRFVAWRGLSGPYRHAVDGHSPWPADMRDPQPICLNDVARADLPEALKRTVRQEGIGALAFIPLTEDRRLLGKFMAYFDAPHGFTEAEIDIALAVARHLGLAVARTRAETARRATERAAQQLASIVESSDDAIISMDLDGVITTWNRGAEHLFGYEAAEAIGQPVTMLMPPDRLDEEPDILARIRHGECIDYYETVRRRKDGRLLDTWLTVSPMRDADGRIVGASKIARDITERKQAETQQRVLLNELNHRIKNNMQMLQSLLYSASRQTQSPEAKKVLGEASGRIAAIAAAQRVLYGTSNATQFNVEELLDAVCHTAQQTLPTKVEIVREAASGELPNDAAVPLALILNELLSNAAKHGGAGKIRVSLTRDGEASLLSVEDDGPGFDWPAVRGRASGLRLVEGLSRQLRGQFEVTRSPASRCTVRFS